MIDVVRHHLEYALSLIENGGPKPEDYRTLDRVWDEVMDAVRIGDLKADDLREIWCILGDVFGAGAGTMQSHALRKPYGYAGDFELIDRIYQYSLCENSKLRSWDEYFQSREACVAVRNRKDYFVKMVSTMAADRDDLRVLNVGCGPARDVLELYSKGNSHVRMDCVDMDPKAIAYAKNLCADIVGIVSYHCVNIFRYSSHRKYDLIWSAGLFDYLDDRRSRILIQRLSRLLRPEGRLVVGNFSTINPTRSFMEFGEWFLLHRTPDELINLAQNNEFGGMNAYVDSEPLGINLFLNVLHSK